MWSSDLGKQHKHTSYRHCTFSPSYSEQTDSGRFHDPRVQGQPGQHRGDPVCWGRERGEWDGQGEGEGGIHKVSDIKDLPVGKVHSTQPKTML